MGKFFKRYLFLIISIIGLIALICFALLLIPESQMPTILQSSGLVAIISAFLGVIITIAVTRILLEQQSETESKKDKDIKIYEHKIQVYSDFTAQLWGMIDDGKITDDELEKLRSMCFQRLVFYLTKEEQIKKITDLIRKINSDREDEDTVHHAIGEITHILQSDLNSDIDIRGGQLRTLFASFRINGIGDTIVTKTMEEDKNQREIPIQNNQQKEITYWHFNAWVVERQINAFKNGNWVLALIEYGEVWRTNLLKQVNTDDVIFLFQRGGAGYIGAFRAIGRVIIEEGNFENKDTAKYDIYDALEDGATLCSNILVEPIAYNYKGIGYYTVRRRTIERMNDMEAVKYLLTRFDGKELGEDRKIGAGKFDDKMPVTGINSDYFNKVLKENKI
jgi:hypothetical protein